MEDITDVHYAHAKRFCKDFENLGEYHDLYVQSHALLLADVFENFKNKSLEIYELDPVKCLSASGLAWQAVKKTKVKLDLLTDIDMLLMVEKGIRGGISHSIYRYAKANNKYIKDYDKNEESPYLQYWGVNNLYGWAMAQKLPVNNFEWTKYTFQFNEDFIKNYNEKSDEGYFLEVVVQYLEKLHGFHNDCPFLPERMKIEKDEKLVANLHDKTEYVINIRNLKQALNHRLVLKKDHKVVKFNQNTLLKPHIDMNNLKFQTLIFKKLMNNAVLGKTMKLIYYQNQIIILLSFSQKIY